MGQQDQRAPAPKHAAEHVAAEKIGTERERGTRMQERGAPQGGRRVRRERGPRNASASITARRGEPIRAGHVSIMRGARLMRGPQFWDQQYDDQIRGDVDRDVEGREQHCDGLDDGHVAELHGLDESLAQDRDRRRSSR